MSPLAVAVDFAVSIDRSAVFLSAASNNYLVVGGREEGGRKGGILGFCVSWCLMAG